MVRIMVEPKTERVSFAQGEPLLSLHDIYAGYGKKEILHGVSLSIKPGELVAIIGTNGAGKSTLLKVVAGLLLPRHGIIIWQGQDITALPAHRRPEQGIAYLMQSQNIFPSLTVWENLQMGLNAVRHGERLLALEEALSLFPDLRSMLHRRAGLLSGGQRQMLALAMTLCMRPRLLLLDEPSAGLAPKLARDILHKVQELNQRLGITILLVEQRVREAIDISSRVFTLSSGKNFSYNKDILPNNKLFDYLTINSHNLEGNHD